MQDPAEIPPTETISVRVLHKPGQEYSVLSVVEGSVHRLSKLSHGQLLTLAESCIEALRKRHQG